MKSQVLHTERCNISGDAGWGNLTLITQEWKGYSLVQPPGTCRRPQRDGLLEDWERGEWTVAARGVGNKVAPVPRAVVPSIVTTSDSLFSLWLQCPFAGANHCGMVVLSVIQMSQVSIYNNWIVLFARFDWFLNLGISSASYLMAASGEKNGARTPYYQKIR